MFGAAARITRPPRSPRACLGRAHSDVGGATGCLDARTRAPWRATGLPWSALRARGALPLAPRNGQGAKPPLVRNAHNGRFAMEREISAAASLLWSAHLRAGRKVGVPGSSPTGVTMPPSASRASRCTSAAQRRRRGEARRASARRAMPSVTPPRCQSCGSHQTADAGHAKDAGEFPGTPTYAPSSCRRLRASASAPTRSATALAQQLVPSHSA
jgi:hypothetical protein